jgi:hypothetical protein
LCTNSKFSPVFPHIDGKQAYVFHHFRPYRDVLVWNFNERLKFLNSSNLLFTVPFPFVGCYDRGGDLRNTLDRRRSPSYRRERGHDWSYDHRLPHHNRGRYTSPSLHNCWLFLQSSLFYFSIIRMKCMFLDA